MTHLIKNLLLLFLALNVWSTTGDETIQPNSTVEITENEIQPSITPMTELQSPQVTATPPEAVHQQGNYDIDRSSYFHSYHHEEDVHHHHHHEAPAYHGFWKKKFIWRPRWVKTWQEKKVYVAVWKRMWGPATLNEWVPIPKPPPGWFKTGVSGLAVKLPH